MTPKPVVDQDKELDEEKTVTEDPSYRETIQAVRSYRAGHTYWTWSILSLRALITPGLATGPNLSAK